MPFFLTRARAVDMLGRQQIAGISTAISELFKNAYDAYANKVEADLLRSEDLFVLRDDGIGMTLNDFTQRWLTIATDSKVEHGGLAKPKIPPGALLRPTLGEKGIGRLAVASLGPVTLILTRAKFTDERDEIVCALFDWEIFELPGINLSDIDIPIVTREPSSLPDSKEIRALAQSYIPLLESLRHRTDSNAVDRISRRLNNLMLDPRNAAERLGGMSLLGPGSSGTHFFATPVDSTLFAELDSDIIHPKQPSNLLRLLVGFSNTMTPGHPPEPIRTAFRDHRELETVDILAKETFFTPDEFRNADHQVIGDFDNEGTFRGKVSVYGDIAEYELPLDVKRTNLACGPFKISLAVVQTSAGETTIPSADYAALKEKLDRFGGLYVYNDGIRVLPYGDIRNDFLEIEQRRTLNVGRFFFSYRKMFGVIELNRTLNAGLKEKAGREGFRENKAFADLKAILKHFFVQLAAEFFVAGGERAEPFLTGRDRAKNINARLKDSDKEAKIGRAKFQARLHELASALDDGRLQSAASNIRARLDTDVADIANIEDALVRQGAILDAVNRSRLAAESLRAEYVLEPPPGLGLPPRTKRDFESYCSDLEIQSRKYIEPITSEADRLSQGTGQEGNAQDGRREYLEFAIQRAYLAAGSSLRQATDELKVAASDLSPRLLDLIQHLERELETVRLKCLEEFASQDIEKLSSEEYFALSSRVDRLMNEAGEELRRTVTAFIAQIERLQWSREPGAAIVTDLEIASAREEKLLALEERVNADLELAQLGLFSQVISHEFIASIRSVRLAIGRLGDWASGNPPAQRIHEDIRTAFDSLDGYLRLFAPLQRRQYGPKTSVRGQRIFTNVTRLFEERIRNEHVTLESSAEFLRFESKLYPSTLFPVLVNLIDNAFYWLERSTGQKRIAITSSGNRILVSNNGPSIPERDRDAIFEPGFSRKPDGRGLGLWISQQALNRDGYELTIVDPLPDMHVTFCIQPKNAETDLIDSDE